MWVNAVRRNGSQALKAGRRGRRADEQKALDPKQEARLRRAVLGKLPGQMALPGLVWTRPQVRQLIRHWFGIGLSLVTVSKYLRSWGCRRRSRFAGRTNRIRRRRPAGWPSSTRRSRRRPAKRRR
jgi:transposase